ncbi:MAG: recombination protein NinB [Pseudomonadota bacterium]
MTGQTIIIRGDTQRALAKRLIDAAPLDHVVQIGEMTRSAEQNAKLHAMLSDIRKAETPVSHHSMDNLKLIFMNELRAEATFLPELNGGGMFLVGQRTSLLGKRQFAALIEIIYAYGAKHGVKWSEPMPLAA